MKVYKSVSELIGRTPLLEPKSIERTENLKSNLYLKLEYLNPTGSVKDRAAKFMIEDAERSGKIFKGATIIEPTSGNTGIGLASICASKGYKVILTMPNTMSKERINLLKAYGAQVVLTDGKLGMAGAITKAKELNKTIENSFIPSQFSNPANANAHYEQTAREIFDDLDGKIDYLVAGVGSGGTIIGCAKFLKEKNCATTIVAVEPDKSPLLSKGTSGAHGIQGIGANFIPEIVDISLIDKIELASEEQAIDRAKQLGREEGVLVGISSGAALEVAIRLAKEVENKNIVVILPDSADRYYSTQLFNE